MHTCLYHHYVNSFALNIISLSLRVKKGEGEGLPTVFPASNYPSAEFSLSPLPEEERVQRALNVAGAAWIGFYEDLSVSGNVAATKASRQKTARAEEKDTDSSSRGEVGAAWMTVLRMLDEKEKL